MYAPTTDRKSNNRQFHEAATLRKAANDTQYFWDLVSRSNNGHSIGLRKLSRYQEENFLFGKKVEASGAESEGAIDDSIPVQRSGPRSDEVQALESFEELKGVVPQSVTKCVELLRFERPTPIQKHAIPLGLAGLDLMCCAQTGSGKTLAFLIPAITALGTARAVRPVEAVDSRGVLPRAIVLAPTRELASQIQLDARRLAFGSTVRSVCVYGGNDIRSQLTELCTGCDIIVATPGRLNDLLERGVVSLQSVSVLVLDEADRMLDMGFEIRRIVMESDMPQGENRQTYMFSATFPSEIQALAREFLRSYVWVAVGRVGSTVENIKQQVLLATANLQDKVALLTNVIDQTEGRTLVFVQKRKTATWLCDTLRARFGIPSEEIHGDRSQAQREGALKAFRDGNIRILVATDVAARGLDVPAVTHVIQFDMPLSAEDFDVYVHRIGRTGRAGKSGLATSFFVPGKEVGEGNGKIVTQLLRLLRENHQEIPDWLSGLDDGALRSNGFGQFNRRNQQSRPSAPRFGYLDSRSNQQSATYQSTPSQRHGTHHLDNTSSSHFSVYSPSMGTAHTLSDIPGTQRVPNRYSPYAQPYYPAYPQQTIPHFSAPQTTPLPHTSFASASYYDPYVASYSTPAMNGMVAASSGYSPQISVQVAPPQQSWMMPTPSQQPLMVPRIQYSSQGDYAQPGHLGHHSFTQFQSQQPSRSFRGPDDTNRSRNGNPPQFHHKQQRGGAGHLNSYHSSHPTPPLLAPYQQSPALQPRESDSPADRTVPYNSEEAETGPEESDSNNATQA